MTRDNCTWTPEGHSANFLGLVMPAGNRMHDPAGVPVDIVPGDIFIKTTAGNWFARFRDQETVVTQPEELVPGNGTSPEPAAPSY